MQRGRSPRRASGRPSRRSGRRRSGELEPPGERETPRPPPRLVGDDAERSRLHRPRRVWRVGVERHDPGLEVPDEHPPAGPQRPGRSPRARRARPPSGASTSCSPRRRTTPSGNGRSATSAARNDRAARPGRRVCCVAWAAARSTIAGSRSTPVTSSRRRRARRIARWPGPQPTSRTLAPAVARRGDVAPRSRRRTEPRTRPGHRVVAGGVAHDHAARHRRGRGHRASRGESRRPSDAATARSPTGARGSSYRGIRVLPTRSAASRRRRGATGPSRAARRRRPAVTGSPR